MLKRDLKSPERERVRHEDWDFLAITTLHISYHCSEVVRREILWVHNTLLPLGFLFCGCTVPLRPNTSPFFVGARAPLITPSLPISLCYFHGLFSSCLKDTPPQTDPDPFLVMDPVPSGPDFAEVCP